MKIFKDYVAWCNDNVHFSKKPKVWSTSLPNLSVTSQLGISITKEVRALSIISVIVNGERSSSLIHISAQCLKVRLHQKGEKAVVGLV